MARLIDPWGFFSRPQEFGPNLTFWSKKVVTSDPLKTLLANAAALQEKGDTAGALKTLKGGHSINPTNAQILLKLGEIYSGINDYANAVQVLQQANQLAPDTPDIMVPYSKALSKTGNIPDALVLAEASLHLEPDSITALENASEVLFKAGKIMGLIKCLERLSALRPDEMRYYSDLARFYEQIQHHEKAYNAYLKLWDDTKANAFDYAKIGEYAFNAHHVDEAIAYLKKSLALEARNAHSLTYLGRCYLALGDKEAAIEALQKALAIHPHFINAYFFLTEIKAFKKDDPAFATLEALKTHENFRLGDAGALGFSLGRMYHNIGEYDKAFENFKVGNNASSQYYASIDYSFNPDEIAKSFKLVAALFSPENRKKLKFKGSKSKKPVFIVGMPRSGTTLLEQIMSAHSEISTAGELRNLTLSHKDMMVETATLMGAEREAALLAKIDKDAENYAASHLKTLEEKGGGTPLVIDKLPQNFLQLGLINVLFPNAKIIHMKRDPMDVGWSIYCNQFSADWRFSRNLSDIGFYICRYRELMADWKNVIDLPLHEVDYESLIDDPEGIARGVIEFCGQDWQPECLEFYKKQSTVYTASVLQVRNPVNKSGLGKWKAYEKHLHPLKQALEA